MCVHLSNLYLHLQASTPSSQLWSNLLLAPPQVLYQEPPGAQQLTRPNFVNVPQVGHVVIAEAPPVLESEGATGVLGICHRPNHRWGDDSRQTVDDIDPGEP